MGNDTLISLDSVSFAYGSQQVLERITLEVKHGEYLGLIGPNGSGKTTLLKVILGLLPPQSGTIQLFGQPVASFKDWHKIGYVPQKPGASAMRFPITVEEVVAMAGGSNEDVLAALESTGMIEKRRALISELSGGQEQRVFIARALVTKPELLILDEPTVGIDTRSQIQFYKLLRNINQKDKRTLILVSHDISVVAHEVQLVACINKTLMCHGAPRQVLKEGFIEKMYGKHLQFVVHEH